MDKSPIPNKENIQFKVVDSKDNKALEQALNDGYAIDKEGTKFLDNVIILHKEK